jgi:hypothetical protein
MISSGLIQFVAERLKTQNPNLHFFGSGLLWNSRLGVHLQSMDLCRCFAVTYSSLLPMSQQPAGLLAGYSTTAQIEISR